MLRFGIYERAAAAAVVSCDVSCGLLNKVR